MYDSRRNLDKEIIDAVKAKFPTEIFNTVVNNNSKLAEAPTFGKDIFEYAPRQYYQRRFTSRTYRRIYKGYFHSQRKSSGGSKELRIYRTVKHERCNKQAAWQQPGIL